VWARPKVVEVLGVKDTLVVMGMSVDTEEHPSRRKQEQTDSFHRF
jgi:hypothetical protein